jgi:tRNA-modifying protein YgfZ
VEAAAIELDGQYRLLREEAGFVERRGHALLAIRGGDAAEYLESQLTNEVATLEPGRGCYAALLDRKGHLQGDMRVLRRADDEILIDLQPEARAAVMRHLGMYRIGRDVEIEDISATHVLISVIGPAASERLGLASLGAEHSHRQERLGDASAVAVAAAVGVDLLVAASARGDVAAHLGASGVEPVTEDAAEVVRVESGRPRFGREMGPETMPAEAGIVERAVSFTKGCYIGQETVARLHYRGRPNRHLRGLRLEAPAAASDPVRLGEREVGALGTAVLSPAHGPIALAILRREAEPGMPVAVGSATIAEVIELPF